MKQNIKIHPQFDDFGINSPSQRSPRSGGNSLQSLPLMTNTHRTKAQFEPIKDEEAIQYNRKLSGLFNKYQNRKSRHKRLSQKVLGTNEITYTPDTSQSNKQNIMVKHSKQNLTKIFQKNVHKVITVTYFLSSLNQYSQQLKAKLQTYLYRRRSFFPFYPDDKFIIIWNQIIKICLFFTAIFYPYYISFLQMKYLNVEEKVLLYFFTVIYLLDFFLQFFVAYVDYNSTLQISFKSIFLNYLKTSMIFDILSFIPYELIFIHEESGKPFQLTDSLHFFKYFRVVKFFQKRLYKDYKGQEIIVKEESFIKQKILFQINLQLLTLMFQICLLTHIFSCIWYYAARIEQFQEKSWIYSKLHLDELTIYIECFYWSSQTVTVVGYGELGHSTFSEFFVATLWLLIGVGYYSFTIGNIAYILSQQYYEAEIQKNTNNLDQLAYLTQMPDYFKKEFDIFVDLNQRENRFFSKLNKKILKSLPYGLKKYLILANSIEKVIQFPFFHQDLNISQNIFPRLSYYFARKGMLLFREGQIASEVFFLVKGDIRVMTKQRYPLLNIMEGTIFGEYEVLEETFRETYGYAASDSLVLICQAQIFLSQIKKSENIYYEMEQLHYRRKQLIIKGRELEQSSKKQLRRSVMLKQIPNFEKELMQKSFNNVQESNAELMNQLIGVQQRRRKQLIQRFKASIRKVQDLLNLLKKMKISQIENLELKNIAKQLFGSQKNLESKFLIRKKTLKKKIKDHHLFNQMMRNFNEIRQGEIKLNKILAQHKKEASDRQYSYKILDIIKKYQFNPKICTDQRKLKLIYSAWRGQVFQEINKEKEQQMQSMEQKRSQLNNINGENSQYWMKTIINNVGSVIRGSTQISMLKFEILEQERILFDQISSLQNLIQSL